MLAEIQCSAIVAIKISSNLLFFNLVIYLVCFARQVIIFGSGKQADAVSVGCSEMFGEIIWKRVGIEYFLSKDANLQPETS